jgi:putative ABC transport system permease protein
VRDWEAFVRARLKLPGLTPAREARVVRELAGQLEDFYRDAIARGATHPDADAFACAQIRDWERMAQDVWLADRRHARPPIERLADAIEHHGVKQRGAAKMMSDILRDMRYAARQLAASPGFTIVAILTLALGIGATSSIFSVVNGVLLRPLPYPDPDRLVRVHEIVPQYGRFAVAPATFLDWRQQNDVFERIATFQSGSATLMFGDNAERVPNANVSWDIFELLGTAPFMGRGFRADEDTPGKNAVIVISYGMWQRRFGGDPNILGRSVGVNGTPTTVVGVMPPPFYFPSREAEFWQPIAINPTKATRGGHFLAVIGRLKPGVSLAQAGSEMKAISERLAQQYPENSAKESAEVVLLHEQLVGGVRRGLLTLLAAVGIVTLIACANVANLLLVRASVRGKELAIRAALGAGRGRLAMQMLAESLVLAVSGGLLGLALAYLAIKPLQTLSAGSVPRAADVTIDVPVLLFVAAVSVVTGILFGLAPAWQASRTGFVEALKEGGRSSVGTGGRWIRSTLLIVELSLSIVLLLGAVLFLRSFARLTHVDPGFRTDNVLAFRVALPQKAYPNEAAVFSFYDRLLDKLRGLPGVTAAGMVQSVPLRGDYVLSFAIQGRPPAKAGEEPSANYRAISPDYFRTLGIPVLRGRAFDAHDIEKAPLVAVVDEAFVHRHFPNEDPIGRGIDIGNGTDGFCQIVGVVGDVHYDSLDSQPTPTMYMPFRQDVFSSMWVLAQTGGDPAQLSAAARQAVREIDRSLPTFSLMPLDEIVSSSVAQQRFAMLLLTLFAAIAVFLAAVGLYGVVAYGVSLRTQEIGVRVAMGARSSQVMRLIVGGGMKLALVGVAVGLVGTLALARLVRIVLFEVTPLDPVNYVITSFVLLAVAALACYVPARRATRVDPLVALRQA